jgi:hypothetical protein
VFICVPLWLQLLFLFQFHDFKRHAMTRTTLDNSTPAAVPPAPEALYSLVAEFPDVDSVMHAAMKVRDTGYTQWDVHSPFPVHGMDKAMGIRPTILPWITLAHGLLGLVGGLLLVWWTNATTIPGVPTSLQGYKFIISGKPTFSLPANIPIIFETTILLAALGTVAGMFALNRLPMLYNPLFKSGRFRRVTSDKFFVVIEASDPKFSEQPTRAFLTELGATAIENISE